MKKEILDLIKNNPNILEAYLFGSRAKKTNKDDSDYDICIVVKDNKHKMGIYDSVTKYMLENKEFIQVLIFDKITFEEKTKIDVYKNEIINNGIKII